MRFPFVIEKGTTLTSPRRGEVGRRPGEGAGAFRRGLYPLSRLAALVDLSPPGRGGSRHFKAVSGRGGQTVPRVGKKASSLSATGPGGPPHFFPNCHHFFFASGISSPSAGGATTFEKLSKNSPASFLAVASMSREPSWAILPEIWLFTS